MNHHIAHWIFQTACACVTCSIVSGGAAERMSIAGYGVFSFIFSAWVYPVVAHWGFGGGWL
jgi:Amt family ammonium transporter